jgi:sugar/nucleoside kinase (ribokinase family)
MEFGLAQIIKQTFAPLKMIPFSMTSSSALDVVVAGHICVDIAPELDPSHTEVSGMVSPGRLTQVGPARLSLGGAVANTGLALHRLGAKTAFLSLVGNDWLGDVLLATLQRQDPLLAKYIRIAEGQASSYTIVISPPQVDRAFLHCPGANDLFAAEDLDLELIRQARWLHFGYPPLMRGVFADGGLALAAQFDRVQQAGVLISLDMAMPDANAVSGQVHWRNWLATVLPNVDLFVPSFDEILWMLHRDRFDQLARRANGANLASVVDGATLSGLANELLELGAPIAAVKLGDQGLYLRTASDLSKIASSAPTESVAQLEWWGRELLAPCFRVPVAGTTAAGDCTVAGLLMAILRYQSIEQSLLSAVRVGAWRVQSLDGECGIPPWEQLATDRAADWRQCVSSLDLRGWSRTEGGVYIGPHDRAAVSEYMPC